VALHDIASKESQVGGALGLALLEQQLLLFFLGDVGLHFLLCGVARVVAQTLLAHQLEGVLLGAGLELALSQRLVSFKSKSPLNLL